MDDILMTQRIGIQLLISAGTATFDASLLAAGRAPSHLLVNDGDGDGAQDLVVSNRSSETVSVLQGTGQTFASADVYPLLGSAAWDVVPGDLDGDGVDEAFVLRSRGVEVFQPTDG